MNIKTTPDISGHVEKTGEIAERYKSSPEVQDEIREKYDLWMNRELIVRLVDGWDYLDVVNTPDGIKLAPWNEEGGPRIPENSEPVLRYDFRGVTYADLPHDA